MTLCTSLADAPDDVRAAVRAGNADGEEFVAALHGNDQLPIARYFAPWLVLTTHRLIKQNSYVGIDRTSDIHLSGLTTVEHEKNAVGQHTIVLTGPGVRKKYTLANPQSGDFVRHIRDQLGAH